jgi:hypothetical protein
MFRATAKVLSSGIKCPKREADHSLPSSTEVKNAWSYTAIPTCRSAWRGAKFRNRDIFTFAST